ncbi:uncharacterized protein I206_101274 [Kwoniella pini CBS 10737]|uniref:Uncharacterized protein n=1 Tax=Kwoniella pini CBS 10737 TaxID=1296096 RepID=A0A1B9IBC3_9TREE|nr:uncharacterized protein I206_00049 [Kwoniella pini CBS 10737]OCF52753.1 hypothetical protein I206_00049 [Kwoniella pini CBS 10737]
MFNKLFISTLTLFIFLGKDVLASSDRIDILRPTCISDNQIYALAFKGVCDHFKDDNKDGLIHITSYTNVRNKTADYISAFCSYNDTKNQNQVVLFTTEVAQALGGDKKSH